MEFPTPNFQKKQLPRKPFQTFANLLRSRHQEAFVSSNPSSIQTRLILGQINLIIFLPTAIAACSLHEAVREIPLQSIRQPMKI